MQEGTPDAGTDDAASDSTASDDEEDDAGSGDSQVDADKADQTGDVDLEDVLPAGTKPRGALAADVYAETLARAKPILQQATATLLGPTYDPSYGAPRTSAAAALTPVL